VNVPPSVTTPLLVKDAAPESLARAERWLDAIRRLGRVTE
jgi:valyl-tRNA synthetase